MERHASWFQLIAIVLVVVGLVGLAVPEPAHAMDPQLILALASAAGAIALIVGYVGVSGTLETGKQLPYVVSGGLAGLFLLGLGALLWVSADLRDEWRKLDALDESVRKLAESASQAETISLPAEHEESPEQAFVRQP